MTKFLANRGQDFNSSGAGEELLKMIGENLDLEKWHFHLSFTASANANNLMAIYNSEYCRISFRLSLQEIPRNDELVVSYGRLHAKNEVPYMDWDGKKCRCWHNIATPLRFLDGLSASDAIRQAKTNNQLPSLMEQFKKSATGVKLLNEYPPKAAIVLHSVIWDRYGQRLFDLFDLRKPKLWEEYEVFVGEYYKLLGMKASFGPPYENIC